ncbi:hypothetical protein STEG23_031827, partial [Scotinomys teguina]
VALLISRNLSEAWKTAYSLLCLQCWELSSVSNLYYVTFWDISFLSKWLMKNPEYSSCDEVSLLNTDGVERFFRRPSEADLLQVDFICRIAKSEGRNR